MSATAAREPSYIDPERLYTLSGFHQISGISRTRVREARRRGVDFPAVTVGRRKFVRGEAAIRYIERLASL
jgi:hypothetical protein